MTVLASMPHYTPREPILSTPCEPAVCGFAQNGVMHESVTRLLDHARQKTAGTSSPVYTEADLKARLGITPAVMSNWKARGISKEGALAAEAEFGCSAHWLLTGKAEAVSSDVWPFALLTPDDIRQLSPKALESVEKLAVSLLEIEGSISNERQRSVTHEDTVLSPRSKGFTGTVKKPDFMKDQGGQRSADPRPSRKRRDG